MLKSKSEKRQKSKHSKRVSKILVRFKLQSVKFRSKKLPAWIAIQRKRSLKSASLTKTRIKRLLNSLQKIKKKNKNKVVLLQKASSKRKKRKRALINSVNTRTSRSKSRSWRRQQAKRSPSTSRMLLGMRPKTP